jgi:CubicO group peptidase (beta-lactamase class C family)
MMLDNVYWIVSCTKLITGIACTQLAESVAIALDGPELVERICPRVA